MPKFVYNVGIQSVPSFRLATGLKHHNSQIKRLEEFYIRLFFQLYTKDKIDYLEPKVDIFSATPDVIAVEKMYVF